MYRSQETVKNNTNPPAAVDETDDFYWGQRNTNKCENWIAVPTFTAQCVKLLRPVYTCDFLCNFCRTFQCNFCRARARNKNYKCKLVAISVRLVAAISQRFRTCSKLDATWRRFGRNCSKYCTGIAAKSLLVYTCDKSCIGERDKNCTKNRLRKRAFTLLINSFFPGGRLSNRNSRMAARKPTQVHFCPSDLGGNFVFPPRPLVNTHASTFGWFQWFHKRRC